MCCIGSLCSDRSIYMEFICTSTGRVRFPGSFPSLHIGSQIRKQSRISQTCPEPADHHGSRKLSRRWKKPKTRYEDSSGEQASSWDQHRPRQSQDTSSTLLPSNGQETKVVNTKVAEIQQVTQTTPTEPNKQTQRTQHNTKAGPVPL